MRPPNAPSETGLECKKLNLRVASRAPRDIYIHIYIDQGKHICRIKVQRDAIADLSIKQVPQVGLRSRS